MMLIPSLLLLLAVSSVMADVEGDLNRCVEMIEIHDMEDMVNMKSREELGVVCPMVQNFMSCIEDVLNSHLGLTLQELAELTAGTVIGRGAELLLNTKSVIDEVCTEGTPLNIDYMADIDCFDGIDNPIPDCQSKADAAYEAYTDFSENAVEGVGDDDFHSDRDCMKTAYTAACIASVIHDTCGRRAFNTFNTIVKRTSIFKNAICSPEGLETLKTSFADTLELEESQKELFRLAFDLRRRRK